MGLLDKHNPEATPRGAVLATVVGAIVGPLVMWLYATIQIWLGDGQDIRSAGFALFSSVIGALFCFGVYWQGWPD